MRSVTQKLLKIGLISAIAWFGACLPPEARVSRFAASEPVQTGNARYDEAFANAASLRTRVEAASSGAKIRRRLTDTLGLPASSSPDALVQGARERIEQLRKDGTRVFAVLVPEPKLVVRKGEGDGTAAKDFAVAIEDALESSLERRNELDGLASEVASAESTLSTLREQLQTSFPDDAQRAQIALELDEAARTLELARLRASTESGRSVVFAIQLAAAVDSGAAQELASIEEKPAAKPKFWGLGKLGKGTGAKPAKPAKPKQDFDP